MSSPFQTAFRSDRGRIPCLDGLRAISVVLVLLFHGRLSAGFPRALLSQNPATGAFHGWKWLPFTGSTGVCLFFIISGFLITSLLLDEREHAGRVCLRNFYIRRGLRIFPPFYCFLAAVLVLRCAGLANFSQLGLLASATYWMNFYPRSNEWILGHTWSLSVEEQFYLFWPILLARLSRWQSIVVTVVFILGWPLLRLLRHGFFFAASGPVALETAALDTILYGSLLALLVRTEPARTLLQKVAHHRAGLYVSVAVLFCIYETSYQWPGRVTFLLPLLRNVSLTCFLWWCVNNPGHRFGRLLEWKPIAFLGVISYSLYLWQQPFLNHSYRGWICRFPQNFVAALIVATLSYFVIERPLNRWRRRWSAAPAVPTEPQSYSPGSARRTGDTPECVGLRAF